MRVNIYAEEMTDRVELIEKEIEGQTFRAVRFYLELPATCYRETFHAVSPDASQDELSSAGQFKGPFIHHPGDDDSAAVTFWGKRDLRAVLQRAIDLMDAKYGKPATTAAGN